MEAVSLFDLNRLVKQTLKERFTAPVWVTAEIASVQENRSGHCYLELVDKPEGEDNPVAVAKGTIWAFTYRMLRPYFETTTGRSLERGMKVLVRAEVVFHEVYGFSLNIKDIDPTFTIGDIERKRREILALLEKDGVIDMNKNLEFPLLPKTVAVISSPTAAGWGDFMNHLEHNSFAYRFHVKLFPAVMQGERAADSVIAALEKIYEYESVFDVVVIIRGGGSQTDLGCFDSYDLAAHVAQFPLPVIAGIGHERDETIVDRVAWQRVKTPTAAAAFLIETFQLADSRLSEIKEEFISGVSGLLDEEYARQRLEITDFKRLTQSLLDTNAHRLKLWSHKIGHVSQFFIYNRLGVFESFRSRIQNRWRLSGSRQENKLERYLSVTAQYCRKRLDRDRHLLELAETKIRYADPKNVLERGYSITCLNGKIVKSKEDVKSGDRLETILKNGRVISRVENE